VGRRKAKQYLAIRSFTGPQRTASQTLRPPRRPEHEAACDQAQHRAAATDWDQIAGETIEVAGEGCEAPSPAAAAGGVPERGIGELGQSQPHHEGAGETGQCVGTTGARSRERELEDGADEHARGGTLMRRLEPVQIVVARLELTGRGACGAAWTCGATARARRSRAACGGKFVEQRDGESAYDAPLGECSREALPRLPATRRRTPFRVFVNGVPQREGSDYELNGKELVFDRPLDKERLSKC
jgi:hypothetical protein